MDSALDDLRQDSTDAHAPLLARPMFACVFLGFGKVPAAWRLQPALL